MEEKITIFNMENSKYLQDIENAKPILEDKLGFELKRSLIERMESDLFYLEWILKNHVSFRHLPNPLNYDETLVFQQLIKAKYAFKDKLASDPGLCRVIETYKENFLNGIPLDGNLHNLGEIEMVLLRLLIRQQPEFITGIVNENNINIIPVNDILYSIPFVCSDFTIGLCTMFSFVSFALLYNSFEYYFKDW